MPKKPILQPILGEVTTSDADGWAHYAYSSKGFKLTSPQTPNGISWVTSSGTGAWIMGLGFNPTPTQAPVQFVQFGIYADQPSPAPAACCTSCLMAL